MFDFALRCPACRERFEPERNIRACPSCSGPLRVEFDFSGREDEARAILAAAPTERRMWDYAAFLPVEDPANAVTLGEGGTPLTPAPNLAREMGLERLWIKNESLNPSGTFKDRCMSVAYSRTRETGGRGMMLGSAGNAAAAASAYAARAGMPCFVLVPESTPRERVFHSLLYGAKVILVKGTVNDCIDLTKEVMEEWNLHSATTASVYNPYQAEGPKTIAYEVARQLEWDGPDWLATPIGGGGILAAIWRGFSDLSGLGLVKALPRMCGVQALGCSAVYNAFRDGASPDCIERVSDPRTIAVAIADPFPLDGGAALGAIYDSGGAAEGLTEGEILSAQALIARSEGIVADPASSCVIGGLRRLVGAGRVRSSDRVVAVVTGTGLKDLRLAGEALSSPPVIGVSVGELVAAMRRMD